jgi:predicted nuclease with TOPRIM domain
VSNTEAEGGHPERVAFKALDAAVGRLIHELATAKDRAADAESETTELQELLRRFTGDEAEAGRLLTRIRNLEGENSDLRERLERGRQGVDRLLARLKFLEEQR